MELKMPSISRGEGAATSDAQRIEKAIDHVKHFVSEYKDEYLKHDFKVSLEAYKKRDDKIEKDSMWSAGKALETFASLERYALEHYAGRETSITPDEMAFLSLQSYAFYLASRKGKFDPLSFELDEGYFYGQRALDGLSGYESQIKNTLLRSKIALAFEELAKKHEDKALKMHGNLGQEGDHLRQALLMVTNATIFESKPEHKERIADLERRMNEVISTLRPEKSSKERGLTPPEYVKELRTVFPEIDMQQHQIVHMGGYAYQTTLDGLRSYLKGGPVADHVEKKAFTTLYEYLNQFKRDELYALFALPSDRAGRAADFSPLGKEIRVAATMFIGYFLWEYGNDLSKYYSAKGIEELYDRQVATIATVKRALTDKGVSKELQLYLLDKKFNVRLGHHEQKPEEAVMTVEEIFRYVGFTKLADALVDWRKELEVTPSAPS